MNDEIWGGGDRDDSDMRVTARKLQYCKRFATIALS
jgi:hypothetical protein